MNKNIGNKNNTGRFILLLLLLTILGFLLYSSTFERLFEAVIGREGSSHGLFVPFLSGYLIWLRRDKINHLTIRTNMMHGSLWLVIGSVLFVLGSYTEYTLLCKTLSFLSITAALILLLYGKQMFVETAFPLFFLATMIPIPQEIYAVIAERLRVVSTMGAVALTKIMGVPLYREGFTVCLPETNLFVAKSCSGIRYLLSFFTFSLVYAVLFKISLLARLAVILFSIPVAIFASVLRLTVIFLAAHYISPTMAEHLPHVLLSWAVFAVTLFSMITVDQILTRKMNRDSSTSTRT